MDNVRMAVCKDTSNRTEQTGLVQWLTSCRFTISIVGFFGTVFLYMMRANMSVAIVCMTRDPKTDANNTVDINYTSARPYVESSCLYEADVFGDKRGEFPWSRELRGFVLSSFYIGYLLTQVLGGWLANKSGAKWIIGGGMVGLTALTLVTPVAARASVYLLMVVQALKGCFSGVYYPAFYNLLGRWAPPNDRSVLTAIFLAGSPVGTVLSSIFSGILCERGFDGGWPSIFYIYGAVSVLWCVAWFFLAYSSPAEHPRISQAELEYIQNSLPSVSGEKTLRVPWKNLLTSMPYYALFLVDMCFAWTWYVALSSLPQYMKDVLKFDIKKNGLFNSLPYMANFTISILGSLVCDFIISRKLMRVTWTRKMFQTFGLIPSAAVSIGVAGLNCTQTTIAIILLTIWVGSLGFCRSGASSNHIDLAPKYAGVVMGIDNTLGTLPGIISPPIVAAITKNGAIEEWRLVFIIGACIVFGGWLFYVIFGSAEELDWSKAESEQNNDKPKITLDNHGFTSSVDDQIPTHMNNNNELMASTKF